MAAPDVVIVDASWHLPTAGRDPKAEYLAEHIPGALFFDIDEIADTESPLPHMLASPEKFASRMRKMGIGDGKRIVVYDTAGLFSAARVWWTFRVFGHTDVAVLDGGLAKWKAEGRPLEDGPPLPRQERHFTARRQASMVSDRDDVLAAIAGKHHPDRRCPFARPLCRRGTRAASRRQGRPHARRPQRPLRPPARRQGLPQAGR